MLIQKSKPKAHRPQHYHGHTIIELRNARTGIRDRVEHDNDFTLGIDQYLTDGGFFNNSPFANETWRGQSIYRNLIGGIFLFDKAINEVNGELPTIMPAGTKMVANGSYGVTNNASPTELGSYNSNESSFTSNGLTFVYDWTTSQGNGTIECVSLTSDTGGLIGYGNSVSNVARSSTYDIKRLQNTINYNTSYGYNNGKFIKTNHVYEVTAQTASSFTYTKKRVPVDSVSLFPLSETHTVNLPAAMTATTQSSYASAGYDGKFVFVPSYITSGQTYVLGIYDVASDTWQTVTFVATATQSVYGQYVSLCDDFVYIYRGTAWSDLGTRIDMDGTATDVYYGMHCSQYGDNLIMCNRYSNTYRPIGFVDLVNNTNYVTNGVSETNDYKIKLSDKNRLEYEQYPSGQTNYIKLYRNPLYLATVNNLDNTVVKTTSDTMKVIYTVTPI